MEEPMFNEVKPWEWLNPIAMDQLQTAVKGKKKEVVLDGVKYMIEYGFRRDYPVSKERIDSIRLTRADGGFVPRGYISVKRIMDFQFEGKK
jgi:hypothetical protein